MSIEKAQKYYKLAKYNAELFSKDPHTKVGALVLAADFSRVRSTGVNGFPRKFDDSKHERWERPTKYKYASHAELNSICNAARTGTPTDGCVLVTTMFPCVNCSKALIQAGITSVYTPEPDYSNAVWGEEFRTSKEMLDEVGVTLAFLETV